MQLIILIIHILVAISLVSIVLLQHGKGADIVASFGNGASGTMFGSSGPAHFLMKLTGTLTTIFFITSLSLAYCSLHKWKSVKYRSSLSIPAPVIKKVKVTNRRHNHNRSNISNESRCGEIGRHAVLRGQ